MAVLSIDFDGVVYDFVAAMRRTCWHYFDGRPWIRWAPEPTTYDWWEEWGLTRTEWWAAFRWGVEAGYVWGDESAPIEGAREALWELHGDGHTIVIMTKKLVHSGLWKISMTGTIDWLERHDIPYDGIYFMGQNASKADVRYDVLLDDCPEHLKNWPDTMAFSQPWNEDTDGSLGRANGWPEFVSFCRRRFEHID